MKKKISLTMFVCCYIILICGLSACKKNDVELKKDYSDIKMVVASYYDLRTDLYNSEYMVGVQKFMDEYPNSKVEFQVNKDNEGLVSAVNSGDVCDVQLLTGDNNLPNIFASGVYAPIDEYIDIDNSIYSKKLIQDSGMYDGKTYGVGNFMMSEFYYGAYNESMFNKHNIKTPAKYYSENRWNRASFLQMTDELKQNQISICIDFANPCIANTYAVDADINRTLEVCFDKQYNRDWLGFVYSIIHDENIRNVKSGSLQRNAGFKVDTLHSIIVDNKESLTDDTIRFIPFLVKDEPISTYINEYLFCVPNGAKDIDNSIKMINYMIDASVQNRTNMYKESMSPEDYEIFRKFALENCYTLHYRNITPEKDMIEFFKNGGEVSEYIDANIASIQYAVDEYNKSIVN